MAGILRGEIRWADLNPIRGREQAGLRPVLILSPDVFNERSGTVIAGGLTSQAPRAGVPPPVSRPCRQLAPQALFGEGPLLLTVELGALTCQAGAVQAGQLLL